MSAGQAVFTVGLAIMWGALFVIPYALIGGRRLWGARRGEPYCGHPFEWTRGMSPRPERWRCPKCRTWFVIEERGGVRRWVMERSG